MASNRKKKETRKTAVVLAISLLMVLTGISANLSTGLPAEARTLLPEAVLKKPVPVVEESVSTYVPSSVAPGNGIAVNIIFPEKVRYKAGAPIAIVVSGNESTSLSMSMHAANCGIAEVRFAYPGCGIRQFHSDGIFDNFGDSCSTALKDVILFMRGETNDYKGRSVKDLIPVKLDQSVLGLVAWETGANIALVTLAKHQEKIPFVSFLAFFEGAAGCMFAPDNLGTVKDMHLNRHYREGSAAAGQILVDYRKLMYVQNAHRHPGVAKKRGETELKGVLYFDDNDNKTWDEASEFALNFASEVGLDKQIYAPPIVEALIRHKVFDRTMGGAGARAAAAASLKADGQKADGQKPDGQKPDAQKSNGAKGEEPKTVTAKVSPLKRFFAKPDAKKSEPQATADAEADKKPKKPLSQKEQDDAIAKMLTEKLFGVQDEEKKILSEKIRNRLATSKSFEESQQVIKNWKVDKTKWPTNIAKMPTSKAYFESRDGAIYIKDVVAGYPKMLFGLFGARVAHTQRQPDHPHIAYLYNKLFEYKPKWLRLNPEPVYVSTICKMNINNFSSNKPNSSLDAANIVEHLAPLGLVPEYAYMDALVAELSDRAKSGNFKSPLATMLSDYTPIPDPRKVEPKPETKSAEGSQGGSTKEAGSEKSGAGKSAAEKPATESQTGSKASP